MKITAADYWRIAMNQAIGSLVAAVAVGLVAWVTGVRLDFTSVAAGCAVFGILISFLIELGYDVESEGGS
jgi:hypothetical protein